MLPDFDVLVTADEAWPAFERAVLAAKTELIAGFRIFDLTTRLRSPEAQAVGQDWFDLLAHALRRGIKITLIVSDFDPVIGTALHEQAWKTVRQGTALAEATGAPPEQLCVRAAMHPAKAGTLPWLALLPALLTRRKAALSEIRGLRRKRQAVHLDNGSLPDLNTVTHHQKLAVVDGEVLYVGGLDLNERRYDTPSHRLPAHETWSDIQLILRGPVAAEARQHLLEFEAACAGRVPPSSLPGLKRTLSRPRRFQLPFLSPHSCLREIEEAHLAAFRSARQLIYVETQFLRSGYAADALAQAARQNPDLTCVIVLPALPDDLAFHDNEGTDARFGLALQKQATDMLRGAFAERLTLAAPVRPVMADRDQRATLAGSPMIYVHNKALIRDADYGLIGSANLNGRSLRWDTEVAVEITKPHHIALLRRKLMGHWWFDPLPEEATDPATLQRWWRDEIHRNGLRLPKNRSGFLVPYDPENEAEIAQPLPGVTENLV